MDDKSDYLASELTVEGIVDTEIVEANQETEPTLPKSFFVQIRGWDNDDEEEARTFGQGVSEWALAFSRVRDLSRLECVIIAWDYPEALASLDTGEGMPVAARTENEYGEGGAMAVSIKRGDELWSSVVIWTPLVRKLMDFSDPEQKQALMTFAHELVHVEDQRIFERTYPGGWRSAKARDARDAEMQLIVNRCQSEYSAQRRSAHCFPEGGVHYLDILEKAMKDVDEQITSARLAYRFHGDVGKFWELARERLAFLFQSIGYALGHSDYVASDGEISAKLSQEFEDRLARISALSQGWLIDACRQAVQPFFTLCEWKDMSIYDDLEEVLEKLLNGYGVYTSVRNDELYLDMPYRSFAEL